MIGIKSRGAVVLISIAVVVFLLRSCSEKTLKQDGNISTYTVTFNSDGGKFANGEPLLKINYRALGFAYAPKEEPKKVGKYFQYWYSTDSLTTFSFSTQRIGFNLELHAKWDINPRVMVLFDEVNMAVTGVDPNYTNYVAIEIPEFIHGIKVLKIANNAFNGKTNISQITLPPSLTDIGNSAFSGCSNLSKCDLPAGLKTLGTNSFYGTSLIKVNIPVGIIAIPASCFQNCTQLSDVSLPASLSGASALGSNCFYATAIKNLTIPDGVTAIPISCFQLCNQLAQITLPSNLSAIGQNAFNGSGLTSVTIPPKVTALGASCFQNCIALTSVSIVEPSLLQTWSNGCLAGCYSLSSLTIPKPSNNSQVTIDVNAFLGNSNLSTVKLMSSNPLVKLNNISAFTNCSPALQILVPLTVLSNYKAAANWTGISNKLGGY
jgi:hypothetical protein